MSTATDKDNPKDSLGSLKVSFGVCPNIARIYWALAMMDGATKYGEMNWRKNAVRCSVYLDAIERHFMALRAGEDLDVDPVTGAVVPHTGRIMACCSIIEDARASGNLIDDRRVDDMSADVLKGLTAYNYQAATLATTRTPADTLDERRGGPFDFNQWISDLAVGVKASKQFENERKATEAAQKVAA
jgi:hypothetical protein